MARAPRTPEQQLKYARGRLRKEQRLLAYLVETAPLPNEKQQFIIKRQEQSVINWQSEVMKLEIVLRPELFTTGWTVEELAAGAAMMDSKDDENPSDDIPF